jgi:hypothetical protein
METRISKREFNLARIERRSNLLERRKWLFDGSLKGEKVCAMGFPLPRDLWQKLKRKEVKKE